MSEEKPNKAPTTLGTYRVRIKGRPERFIAKLLQNDRYGFSAHCSRENSKDMPWWFSREARLGLIWGEKLK